jgi:hypothetical protein
MTLRDELGEVEVGIGDLFELKTGNTLDQLSATFSVICPNDIHSRSPSSLIWVRLIGGSAEFIGKRYEVRQDGNEALRYPVLPFTAELVARLVREHRLMTFDIQPVPQMPAQKLPKAPRARTSKKDSRQNQPTSDSLFD